PCIFRTVCKLSFTRQPCRPSPLAWAVTARGERALDQLVRDVVAAYLTTVDREAPALIEALYLVGSVPLDDFHPAASDIDFLAVTSRPLSEADLSALTRTHAALAARYRRPFFDGSSVTWPD